jgi:hypothetical protein
VALAAAAAAAGDGDDDTRPKLTMQDDNDGPKVGVRSLEDTLKDRKDTASSLSSVNYGYQAARETREEKKVTATFGTLSVEDLKRRMIPRDAPQKDAFAQKKEDLNGIQPLTPLLFSIFPAVFCVLFWQLSAYMTNHFAVDFITSDLYPVRRLASISRNLVVGIVTLASGFTGVVALGLFLLGVTVSVGVVKGELDPDAPRPQDAPKKEF